MERHRMESYLMEEYYREMEYLEKKLQSQIDYLSSNPYLSQSSYRENRAKLEQQYEYEYRQLRNRMEQAIAYGVRDGKSSWMEAEAEIKQINTKKINGKESCPELYKILKSRKSIHH